VLSSELANSAARWLAPVVVPAITWPKVATMPGLTLAFLQTSGTEVIIPVKRGGLTARGQSVEF